MTTTKAASAVQNALDTIISALGRDHFGWKDGLMYLVLATTVVLGYIKLAAFLTVLIVPFSLMVELMIRFVVHHRVVSLKPLNAFFSVLLWHMWLVVLIAWLVRSLP